MALAVETHPQRQDILNWLDAGEDAAAIARKLRPKLHSTTIWRYQRKERSRALDAAKIPSSVVSALEQRGLLKDGAEVSQIAQVIANAAETQLAADPYLARIAEHRKTIDASLKDASTAKDGRTVAALVGVDLKGLELDARLTNRLDSAAAGNQTIVIVTPAVSIQAQPSGPEPMVIDVTPSGR
jgi:hypothetical protein